MTRGRGPCTARRTANCNPRLRGAWQRSTGPHSSTEYLRRLHAHKRYFCRFSACFTFTFQDSAITHQPTRVARRQARRETSLDSRVSTLETPDSLSRLGWIQHAAATSGRRVGETAGERRGSGSGCAYALYGWQGCAALTPFPRRGFRLLSSRHHRLKIFAKRTFPRWRALPLGRDLTRVRHDAMGFARSPSGSSLPLRYR